MLIGRTAVVGTPWKDPLDRKMVRGLIHAATVRDPSGFWSIDENSGLKTKAFLNLLSTGIKSRGFAEFGSPEIRFRLCCLCDFAIHDSVLAHRRPREQR